MSIRPNAARAPRDPKRAARSGAQRPAAATAPAASPVRSASPARAPGPAFDVLTDVLDHARLESAVLFTVELRGAHAVRVVRRGRAPFYVVSRGRVEVQLEGDSAVHVARAGDLVLIPGGAPHVVRTTREAPVIAFDDFLALHPMDAAGRSFALDPHGPRVRLSGGFFSSTALRASPLFDVLPPLIHLDGRAPEVAGWLGAALAFIEREIDQPTQGSRALLHRLADVLFIQTVRVFLTRGGAQASGWLRGLADPRIGRALGLLHASYAEPWTLERLAREAGLSRTLLAARFRELVGEPPMSYLARWRIARAAQRLREERTALARIAQEVGYGSEVVFAKAFRRIVGVPPGRWRRDA